MRRSPILFNSIKSIEEKYENRICIILDHEIVVDANNVSAITSGCGKGSVHIKSLEEGSIKSIASNCKFAIVDILKLMSEFNSRSELFRQTGGVHSCCICNDNHISFFGGYRSP